MNLTDPQTLVEISKILSDSHNKIIDTPGFNHLSLFQSFTVFQGFINKLAKLKAITFLGIGSGATYVGKLSETHTTPTGIGFWFGIGELMPDTNYYPLVMGLSFDTLIIRPEGTSALYFTPMLFNLRTARHIEQIQTLIEQIQTGVEFDVTVKPNLNEDEFTKFMQGLMKGPDEATN